MLRIPLLIQQLNYVDILPMYLILLFCTPLALWLAPRAGVDAGPRRRRTYVGADVAGPTERGARVSDQF